MSENTTPKELPKEPIQDATHSDGHPPSSNTSNVKDPEFVEGTSKGPICSAVRFGKAEWATYFGDIGQEPPLPDNIDAILNSPCPFFGDKNKKVKDTHELVLIPATIGGEPLTLNKLQEIIQNPKQQGTKINLRWGDGSEQKIMQNPNQGTQGTVTNNRRDDRSEVQVVYLVIGRPLSNLIGFS